MVYLAPFLVFVYRRNRHHYDMNGGLNDDFHKPPISALRGPTRSPGRSPVGGARWSAMLPAAAGGAIPGTLINVNQAVGLRARLNPL